MIKIFSSFFKKITTPIIALRILFISFLLVSGGGRLHAANLVMSPSLGVYHVGQTFSVELNLNNNQDIIDEVSGSLDFPIKELEVISVSKSGSLINTWNQEPVFSNSEGTINFDGSSAKSSFTASAGKIITVTFKALQAGTTTISMKSGSILANDGNETNVLGTLGSATFTLLDNEQTLKTKILAASAIVTSPLVITSAAYPSSLNWYKSREASFKWLLQPGITAVRTLYDDKEISTPTKVYQPAIDGKSFTLETDGIMYMHVQAKNALGWEPVVNYKFQIDTQPPESIEALLVDGTTTTNPTPIVSVIAKDKLSGVDYLSMSVDGENAVTYPIHDSNLYYLPKKLSGEHQVLISAFDKAGNKSDFSLDYKIETIAVPVITSYTKDVDFGSDLQVAGDTYPKATVEVALTDSTGKMYYSSTLSNERGEFKLIWSGKLSDGVYQMRVRAIDSKKAVSEFSESHLITLENIPFVRLGANIINGLAILLVVGIALLSVIVIFWYLFTQFSRFRRKVHHTISEIENTLRTNVTALRRDIEEFRTILIKAEKKRDLTKEEQSILKKFSKRLEITEKEIEKKLEAIR